MLGKASRPPNFTADAEPKAEVGSAGHISQSRRSSSLAPLVGVGAVTISSPRSDFPALMDKASGGSRRRRPGSAQARLSAGPSSACCPPARFALSRPSVLLCPRLGATNSLPAASQTTNPSTTGVSPVACPAGLGGSHSTCQFGKGQTGFTASRFLALSSEMATAATCEHRTLCVTLFIPLGSHSSLSQSWWEWERSLGALGPGVQVT